VHGDIKPDNSLIFKEESGKYRAKVIDFGYSARYTDKEHQLELRGTLQWNAPEHDDHHALLWTLQQATKADLFSLGMLYLWLLFEPDLSGLVSFLQDFKGVFLKSSSSVENPLSKKKSELQLYACQLLAQTSLEESEKTLLGNFFESSLSLSPEERQNKTLTEFLKLDSHE